VPPLQGGAFVFDKDSVRIEPPSARHPEGIIYFTGTCRADNARYQVRGRWLLVVWAGCACVCVL